ncbi:hypothetical protein [Mycolicibacterium sp. XJ1819]
MNHSRDWIRSPQSRTLLALALAMSLVLGATFVVVERTAQARGGPDAPLSDDQAVAQVVASAREIVATAHLRDASGGYSFLSCTDEASPPYQASLYMNFLVPHRDWVGYFREVASAMMAGGWRRAPTNGEHFGHKLTKDGVTSVFHRHLHDPGFATMRLYGQCRNTADHRGDDPVWTEVSLDS